MCIRDRYMIGIGLNLAGNKIEEFLNSDDFIAVLIGCTFESVSYTHLRAHETVLDLVCRLLLEKKKIIRY